MVRFVFVIGFSLVMAIGGTAQAQFVNEPYIELSFEAADQNGDGLVCEAELVADTAVMFAGLDRNDDDRLSRDEADRINDEVFAALDTDGDGQLSFSEIMTPRLAVANDRDPNGDGCWTLDELVTSVNSLCERLANGETVKNGPFISSGADARCLVTGAAK